MKDRVADSQTAKLTPLFKKKSRPPSRLWRDLAARLSKPRRIHHSVNVSRINRATRAGDVIVVPGKVLGAGMIDHSVEVAALAFSKEAERKIVEAGGKCLSLLELADKNPDGGGIRIFW